MSLDELMAELVDAYSGAWAAPELRRLRAVLAIRRSFFHPVAGGLQPITHRAYFGLGRWRRGSPRTIGTVTPWPAAPWGWRWLKVEDRNAAICLPLWLYWPIYLWRYRWGIVCEPLVRWGLWRTNEDGGYYWDGRPTFPAWVRRAWWCFLHDRDAAPPECGECGRIGDGGRLLHGWLYLCGRCGARLDASARMRARYVAYLDEAA